MEFCEICHSIKKIVFHHLSYDPEFGIYVCKKCHFPLHQNDIESLEKIIKLKKEYGHLWVNGNYQYFHSKHASEIRRKYAQSEKGKEKAKVRTEIEGFKEKTKNKRKEYLKNNSGKVKQLRHNQYSRRKEKNPEKLKKVNRKAGKKYRDKKRNERVALPTSV